MKKLLLIAMAGLFAFSFTACSSGRFMKDEEIKKLDKNPTGTIVIVHEDENGREQSTEEYNFELYYSLAPITVTNFVSLIKSDFYKGLVFHRVENSDGMKLIQGGGYERIEGEDNLTPYKLKEKKLKYSIMGEFYNNGWKPEGALKNELGTLGMARATDKNSASSQFYVNLGDNTGFNKEYAVFGRITSSNITNMTQLLNVEKSSIPVVDGDSMTAPKGRIYIKSITVDTNGVDLGEPLKVK